MTTPGIDGVGMAVRRIQESAIANGKPYTDNLDSGDDTLVHVVPDGYRVVVTDLMAQRQVHASRPERKTGGYTVKDLGSFLSYFDKHNDSNEAEIWVRASGITAVINAHSAAQPEFEDHYVTLKLEHSPEWQAWIGISGKLLDQQAFAEFLEANAPDILQPVMGEVLEVAQSLEATTKVDFKSAYRTTDGQRAFKYEETTQAKAGQKGELEIPERLVLALRVYTAAQQREVVARFRYRLQGDRLAIGIVIDQQERLRQAELEALADDIAQHVKDRALVLTS